MENLFEEYGLSLIECILCLAICSVLFGFVVKDPATGEKENVGILPAIMEIIPEEGE